MNLKEAIIVLKTEVPDRIPVKYAQSGDKWYFYTENTLNNGKHLPVIENGYFTVEGNSVLPIIPIDMPDGLCFNSVTTVCTKG